ncbi:MAG: mechanosensitive ion channel protein MscS [Deltaproteobacteria bacterium]|nr:MAG: mechanosensitive ion channel protein MscS [Desulfobacterales bacterium]PIE72193.1 MAG: mechanosensitive ion channel protein MscS [Deltaproteobacteria bacterium]
MKYSISKHFLSSFHLPQIVQEAIDILAILVAVGLLAWIITSVQHKTVLVLIQRWLQKNRYAWDDPILTNRVLYKLSWLIPLSMFSVAVDSLFVPGSTTYVLLKRLITSGLVIVGVIVLSALFSTINDIHRTVKKKTGHTLRGYTDAAKIVTYVIGIIFLVSIFTGKPPWGIFSVLGGLTAVVLLVFRDAILGFIASIHLNANDIVRIGDWVQMPQYGADGEIIDISILSVKVQNWDKTISTIPPYSMVSGSVKNWRGMSESGGRRIKRSLAIDMQTIRFCDQDMLNRLSEITLIKDYLREKQQSIEKSNSAKGLEKTATNLLNGRCQTNIGIFRAYVIAYLKNNPHIHQNMTFLVRQLAPNEHGLPLEIYVFSKDQVWANYEAIQSDIFDHLIAAIPHFDLRIFQQPSGYDLQQVLHQYEKTPLRKSTN